METIELINGKKVITEVTCDICGISCLKDKFIIDNELRDDHGQYAYSFEYLSMDAMWGFHSDSKDCEKWKSQVCEKCVDEHLSNLIIFSKFDYMLGNKPIYTKEEEKRRKVLNREVRLNKLLDEDNRSSTIQRK